MAETMLDSDFVKKLDEDVWWKAFGISKRQRGS